MAMKTVGPKSEDLATIQEMPMRAKCPAVWLGRQLQLHIVQRLLFLLFAGSRGWLIISSATILLAMLAIEIVASPCDPRVPRDCNDPPPPVGNSCAPGCMWTDDGIFPRCVGDLCRFRSPSCGFVPPTECNVKVRAYQLCRRYSCRDASTHQFCSGVNFRFSYEGTVYQFLGIDCNGNPCPNPVAPVPIIP